MRYPDNSQCSLVLFSQTGLASDGEDEVGEDLPMEEEEVVSDEDANMGAQGGTYK